MCVLTTLSQRFSKVACWVPQVIVPKLVLVPLKSFFALSFSYEQNKPRISLHRETFSLLSVRRQTLWIPESFQISAVSSHWRDLLYYHVECARVCACLFVVWLVGSVLHNNVIFLFTYVQEGRAREENPPCSQSSTKSPLKLVTLNGHEAARTVGFSCGFEPADARGQRLILQSLGIMSR